MASREFKNFYFYSLCDAKFTHFVFPKLCQRGLQEENLGIWSLEVRQRKQQTPGGSQGCIRREGGLEDKFLNTQGSAVHFDTPSVVSLKGYGLYFSLEKEVFPFLRNYKCTCWGQLPTKLLQLSRSFHLLGFPFVSFGPLALPIPS